MAASALYVHIPFCTHICYYCDFNKFYIKDQPVDEYVDALVREIRLAYEKAEKQVNVHSVYIGGGTPTALNVEQLQRVLEGITKNVPLSKEELEFTVEVNPGEAELDKLHIMRSFGVNRLSIGVQSFDDYLLRKIGRAHTSDEAEKTVALAKKAGFHNISIDLMFGLPQQTIPVWENTIDRLLTLGVTHVSAYSLKVEKKTMFYNWYKRGELKLLSEDTEADMYELLTKKLSRVGYTAYEISNFSLPGYESRHNKTYWQNDEYYGFGAGAHGYVDGVRYANIGPLPHYLEAMQKKGHARKNSHTVTKNEKMEEEMFMGLRMKEGVSEARFIRKYGKSYLEVFGESIKELKDAMLIEEKNKKLKLTEKGHLLGNEVFEKFLLS